jgi:LPXTG-motif cell wall-anchored protein
VTLQSNSITNDSCAAVVPASTPVVALTPIEELIREYELFFASKEFLATGDGGRVFATEDGGRLPDTNSNSYNYLLIGGSLLVLGTSGLLLRRRLSK